MGVLKALAAEIFKMFAADLWLTIAAVATVGAAALAVRERLVDPARIPFLVAAAVVMALAVGVIRGARS